MKSIAVSLLIVTALALTAGPASAATKGRAPHRAHRPHHVHKAHKPHVKKVTPVTPAPTTVKAVLKGEGGSPITGNATVTKISDHAWKVDVTINNAPQNGYSVGAVTKAGKDDYFMTTACEFLGQGTLGCSVTVDLQKYQSGGTPVSVSVMGDHPASGGALAVATGELH